MQINKSYIQLGTKLSMFKAQRGDYQSQGQSLYLWYSQPCIRDILGIVHVPTAHSGSETAEQSRSSKDPDTARMFTQVILSPFLPSNFPAQTCSRQDGSFNCVFCMVRGLIFRSWLNRVKTNNLNSWKVEAIPSEIGLLIT